MASENVVHVGDEAHLALVEAEKKKILGTVLQQQQLLAPRKLTFKYSREFIMKFQNVAVSRPEIFNALWPHELVRGLPMTQHHKVPQMPVYFAPAPHYNPYMPPGYPQAYVPPGYAPYQPNYAAFHSQGLSTPRPPYKKSHNAAPPSPPPIGDLTPHKIEQRQKQIEFGYRSIGYIRYISLIPKSQRLPGMPQTPRVDSKVSKRIWDNDVRHWRRELHKYDPTEDLNFVPDEKTLKTIFGEDVDINEAIKLLHEKELEYKNQLKLGGDPEGETKESAPVSQQSNPIQSSVGFDVRGMPIRYLPGPAAEAAKKVEWHASKSKKLPAPDAENQVTTQNTLNQSRQRLDKHRENDQDDPFFF